MIGQGYRHCQRLIIFPALSAAKAAKSVYLLNNLCPPIHNFTFFRLALSPNIE
ncbi:hypothetical protein NT01EI_1260 [Edwardsiella ictaluri 93-146]|uniref:Uncharacterized protein n=1 Tax=Edwardsiella ictaluri (strain 93-146) TaxID=634503 RepID=C5B7F5_EDWI9|nr:hypothetical protein NT01EI_1260 [Edwardsiella ictaluri 93-146]